MGEFCLGIVQNASPIVFVLNLDVTKEVPERVWLQLIAPARRLKQVLDTFCTLSGGDFAKMTVPLIEVK